MSRRKRLLDLDPPRHQSTEAVSIVPRPPVSLTMIVKNEEANLPGCLETVRGLFGETIVVDTGSRDRTREVARSFGAKVFDHPWSDSFSVARNWSIDHAEGDWIFWLDADDRIDDLQRPKLRELLGTLDNDRPSSYWCHCVSLSPWGGAYGALQPRLFPRQPGVRWRRHCHELIDISALPRIDTNLAVTHTGYTDRDTYRRKHERNLRLLALDLAERPDDPTTLHYMAMALLGLDRWAEAIARFEQMLGPLRAERLRPDRPLASAMAELSALIGIGEAHFRLGDRAAARAAWSRVLELADEDPRVIRAYPSLTPEDFGDDELGALRQALLDELCAARGITTGGWDVAPAGGPAGVP